MHSLPEDKVPEGVAHLREHTPVGMEELVDSVYITGTFRRVQQGQVQPRAPPSPLRV